jgi:hypothetical protein
MPTRPPLLMPPKPLTRPTKTVMRTGHVSPDEMLQWMSSVGLDATNEQIAAEAGAISDELQGVVPRDSSQGVFARNTLVAGSSSQGHPWWMLGTWVALCLATWLLGIRLRTTCPR